MFNTKYHRPTTLSEAIAALLDADDGKLLAGGQTLIPTMKQRLAAPSDVIDLRHIDELKGIKDNGNSITIGAGVTHAEIETSESVKAGIPSLSALAGRIGDPHVRHMGTLGGSVANNDPAADYPAAVLGLGATLKTSKRDIAADDFFDGMFTTVLDEDEIIISITFPKAERAAYVKFPNPASRYAMAGAFVAKLSTEVRVTVTGAGADGVFRHTAAESALANDFSSAALAGISVSADDMLSDMHGSAEYRANIVNVITRRAVDQA